MSDGTREAAAAAHWWADRLREHDKGMDVGAAVSSALASYARSRVVKVTPEQIEAFREHLRQALIAGPVQSDGWRRAVAEGEPRWGSALRSFGVDYGPDQILDDAMASAGIPKNQRSLALPFKTVMWFNPGQVTVGHGYGAEVQQLELAE